VVSEVLSAKQLTQTVAQKIAQETAQIAQQILAKSDAAIWRHRSMGIPAVYRLGPLPGHTARRGQNILHVARADMGLVRLG
jgi:hypothetical protein